MISEAALAEFLMMKPPTCPILPRCQRINLDQLILGDYPWYQFYTGLLHEGVQEISICVPERSPNDVLNFFEESTWRSPNITSLIVETELAVFDGGIVASLSSSILKLRKLTRAEWQSCLLTAQMLSTLEQLPDLKEILIKENTYREGREIDGTLPKTVAPSPFPHLTSLMLQCSLDELCRYMPLADGIAPGLLNLTIDVISKSRPEAFQNVLTKIAVAFPNLVSLAITRNENFDIFDDDDDDDEATRLPLTYQNLRPLTMMPHLETFQLKFDGVVSLTNSTLCSLLAQCSSMRILRLNQEPMTLSQTDLSINVLPMIARVCPQLEDLALYVNTKVDSPETSSLHTFERLKTIDLGLSLLENKLIATTLLAQVLPDGCKLISKPVFDLEAEDLFAYNDEDSEVREERRNEWAQVSEWMSILLKVRRESCERSLTKRAVGQT